jgi:hypothetical protein
MHKQDKVPKLVVTKDMLCLGSVGQHLLQGSSNLKEQTSTRWETTYFSRQQNTPQSTI